MSNDKIEVSRGKERASLALEIPVEAKKNAIPILVLQHPQEPDKELGTAALLVRALSNAKLKVGLSWSSLSKAYGSEQIASQWAVLYLGAKGKNFPSGVNFVNKKNELTQRPEKIAGIVVLDGTWSQAKALWWRNSWLLKLKRIVLNPPIASQYGTLRREPRKDAISTIESVAYALGDLEGKEIELHLQSTFARMLEEYRNRKKASSIPTPL